MAVILEGPEMKRVKCQECGSIIGYLPEDVQRQDTMHQGESGWVDYVWCPRTKCLGRGIVASL